MELNFPNEEIPIFISIQSRINTYDTEVKYELTKIHMTREKIVRVNATKIPLHFISYVEKTLKCRK